MTRRHDQAAPRPTARVFCVALLSGSLALSAAPSDVTAPIERTLAQAEQALQNQELQLTESRYRDALLEGWLLMGSLETIDGDLAAARDALRTAARSAVTGSEVARTALAQLDQGTGEKPAGGPLATLPEADRAELRSRLRGTLGLVYRNLGVLCDQSRRPRQAAAFVAQADAIDPPGDAPQAVPGSRDLRASPPPADLVVQPFRGDEEELVAALAAAEATAPVTDKAAAQKISQLHQDLARLLFTRGDEEKAAAELRTAAELGTPDLDLGLKLAELEATARDFAAARRILQVLGDAYSSPRALIRLAELTWRLGPPESLPILLQVRELAPNSEEVLSNTANAYLAAEEPEKALEALAPLMAMSPDIPVYFRLLAEAHTQLGRLDEAAAALREATALEPSSLSTRIQLASVLLRQKSFDAAEAVLREILADEPEQPDAKDLLAFLEKERGRSPNGD